MILTSGRRPCMMSVPSSSPPPSPRLSHVLHLSYALFDTDSNKVPQELVTKVGKTFESILKETDQIRQEYGEDMPMKKPISRVFKRRPDLRLEGLANKATR